VGISSVRILICRNHEPFALLHQRPIEPLNDEEVGALLEDLPEDGLGERNEGVVHGPFALRTNKYTKRHSLRGSLLSGILPQRVTSSEGQPKSETTLPSMRYSPAPRSG